MESMDLWDEFSFLETADKQDEWSLESWCNSHGERGELLAKEWDRDKNLSPVGLTIELSEVSATQNRRKYGWKCQKCGNKFFMTPWCRTREMQGCPKCGKKSMARIHRENATACGNDLFTWCNDHGEFGSTLAKEWDSERNMKLHGLSMNGVSQKSSLNASWICSRCGNHYEKTVYKRVALGIGCPACNRIGTSFPEQVIYRALWQRYPDTINRKKLFDNIEYDIYIPSKKVAIEYNGSYWHNRKETRDEMKKCMCLQHGIRFFRINADNGCINMKFDDDEISYNISSSNHKEQLKEIISYVLKRLGSEIEEIDFEKAVDESYGQMLGYIDDNFTKYEPRLLMEWDRELNKKIEPEFFTRGSHQRVKWHCRKCGYVFENSINSRIRFRSGCARCGYNIFDDRIHKKRGISNSKQQIQFGMNNI